MSSVVESTLRQDPATQPAGPTPAAEALRAAATPSPSAKSAARIGRYAILRALGEGGMGVVYVAYDEELDRKVAVKLLRDADSSQPEQRLRIQREAQAMARVAHPNVVAVYEVGEHDGQVYIAMEFVDGTTLAEWQRSTRPWGEVLEMYQNAGQGLLAAHQAGLVHRDFKPDNVLVGRDGRPRVADFGLARNEMLGQAVAGGAGQSSDALDASVRARLRQERAAAEAATEPGAEVKTARLAGDGGLLQSPLTQAGAILGTPAYMSPEQHDGQPTDARSDQFSFCAALWEALYGQRPFAGDTLLSLSFNVLQGRLRPIPAGTVVPGRIGRALQKGLSVDPAARFPSMAELLQAIDVDPRRDPTGAVFGRRLFSWACIATLLINQAFLGAARLRGTLTVRDLLWSDLLLLGIAIVVAKLQRRTLMQNGFHRGLVSLVLVGLAQTVIVRAVAEFLAFKVEQILTLDMIILAGMYTLIALWYLRGAWVLSGVCLVGALVHLLPPSWEYAMIALIYPTVGIGLIWLWSRAAGNRGQCSLLDGP
jgi:serine/threonine protein kinase